MTSPYEPGPQPVTGPYGDPYASSGHEVQPQPYQHPASPPAHGPYHQPPMYGAGLPAQSMAPFVPAPGWGMAAASHPTPQGRSAVTTSAVLGFVFGWVGALIGIGNHQGNDLTRQNLRSVMNLQLSALITLGGGFIASLVFPPLIFVWMVLVILYGVSNIMTMVQIGDTYSRGEVYKPFMAFKLL